MKRTSAEGKISTNCPHEKVKSKFKILNKRKMEVVVVGILMNYNVVDEIEDRVIQNVDRCI